MKKLVFLVLLFCTACTKKPTIIDTEDVDDIVNKIDPNLVLVNKQHPIKEMPTSEELELVIAPGFREIYATYETQQAYYNFLNEAPYEYLLYSGYRTIEYQEKLYKDSGYDNTLVAKPYESEHHTGLALDISFVRYGISESFGNSTEGKYLRDNMHKYGFILRYPKGKEDITGYSYEPWHFRYVGIEHATKMFEKKLTLEEYLVNIS